MIVIVDNKFIHIEDSKCIKDSDFLQFMRKHCTRKQKLFLATEFTHTKQDVTRQASSQMHKRVLTRWEHEQKKTK